MGQDLGALNKIEVLTYDGDDLLKKGGCYMSNHDGRKWLMKHICWAVSHGYSVDINPVGQDVIKGVKD